eukprot:GILK01007867.1.p1 GENE.GILK01007867.1~~GILK01007867.1.p1  ORF type:complete len:498 (+),score=68.22 GILK01007867.1:46-1494(+)
MEPPSKPYASSPCDERRPILDKNAPYIYTSNKKLYYTSNGSVDVKNGILIDQAIDEIGMGSFQYKLLAVCGLGWMADAMEQVVLAYLFPLLKEQWHLTKWEMGLLGSAVGLGMMIGAIFWGYISDTRGRKLGFVASVVITAIFGVLGAVANNFALFVVFRVILAFGIGGNLPIDFALLAEYMPTAQRGFYLVLMEGFWTIGSICSAGLAWICSPNWRLYLVLVALPSFFVLLFRSRIPESPRFLLVRGRGEEAQAVLQQVARENGKVLPDRELLCVSDPNSGRIKDLFIAGEWRLTIPLWSLWFFAAFGGGIFLWIPEVLKMMDQSTDTIYETMFVLSAVPMIGVIAASVLVDRIGRRFTAALGLGLASICLVGFAFTTTKALIMVSLAVWHLTLGMAWCIIYTVTPELYPTDIRTTAFGAASALNRLAGTIHPFVGALVVYTDSLAGIYMYAVCLLLGCLSALLIPIETTGIALRDTRNKA